MLSAPATIPATSAGTFNRAFGDGTLSLSDTSSASPHNSANASTGGSSLRDGPCLSRADVRSGRPAKIGGIGKPLETRRGVGRHGADLGAARTDGGARRAHVP